MLNDVSCPTEFKNIEQVEFDDGRRLACLTFLNESDEIIIGLSGFFSMFNEKRRMIDRRRVTFKNLNVKPREAYVLNLRLDDYPTFFDAHMSVESISFLMQDSWQSNEKKAVGQKPPNAVAGNEKAALSRIAKDAIRFPEQMASYWTCVCGRHNPNEWNICSGCGRIKQKVFSVFNKETVMAAARTQRPEHKMAHSVRHQPPSSHESIRQKEARYEKYERILLFITLFFLVGAIVLWGYAQFKKEPNKPSGELTTITMERSPRVSPAIDYLDPV